MGRQDGEPSRPQRRGDFYIEKSLNSDTLLGGFYWDMRFVGYTLFREGPRLLWDSTALLRGAADGLDEDCGIKGCGTEAVTHVPDNKPHTDGTPVCRRHYLLQKGALLLIAVVLITLLAGSLWVIA